MSAARRGPSAPPFLAFLRFACLGGPWYWSTSSRTSSSFIPPPYHQPTHSSSTWTNFWTSRSSSSSSNRPLNTRFCQAASLHDWTSERNMSSTSTSSNIIDQAMSIPSDVQDALKVLYQGGEGGGDQVHLCIITTGAGGHLGAWMLGTSGASNVLIELSSPYSYGAITEYLNHPPSGAYCSHTTAIELAQAAYHRALYLSLKGEDSPSLDRFAKGRFVGVACTASVVSTTAKKGDHRAHICSYTHTEDGRAELKCYILHMSKGARTRIQEDYAVSKATLAVVMEATYPRIKCENCDSSSSKTWMQALSLGVSQSGAGADDQVVPYQEDSHHPVINATTAKDPLLALANEVVDKVLYIPTTSSSSDQGLKAYPYKGHLFPWPTIIYPGSFNPLHEGHLRLTEAAQQVVADLRQGQCRTKAEGQKPPVIFEIASLNADKGLVNQTVLETRIAQFSSRAHNCPVVLTRTPLFVEKARLFPGAFFLIGADTVQRLLDKKYYGESRELMMLALGQILDLGCRFIVGGRLMKDGTFLTLEAVLNEVDVPSVIQDMFTGLSEEQFRVDLSSTEIRARLAAAPAVAAQAGEGKKG